MIGHVHNVLFANGAGASYHSPMTGVLWIDILIVIGLIGGASWVLRRPARWLRALAFFLDHFMEDWNGIADRPGVKGRPGVMVRLSAIEAEVHPNGGGSIKDAVNAIRVDASAAKATAEATQKIALRTDKALAQHLASTTSAGRP